MHHIYFNLEREEEKKKLIFSPSTREDILFIIPYASDLLQSKRAVFEGLTPWQLTL